jgi:hypothetical protein
MPATWAWAAAKRLTIGSLPMQAALVMVMNLKVDTMNVASMAIIGVAATTIVLEASISQEDPRRGLGESDSNASHKSFLTV